jgi:GTPase SAR1 family protein
MNLDPNIQNVILGVVGNIFTSFLYYSANKGIRLFVGEKNIKRKRMSQTSLEPILTSAIAEVFEGVEWDGSTKSTEICLFLGSPEVEDVVRQIFSSLLLQSDQTSSFLSKIELEFKTLISLHVDLEREELDQTSTVLLNTLVSTCDAALQVSIDKGVLAAHEARSVFRHHVLSDQIATIQRNVEFLTSQKKLDVAAILAFEEQYRTQVATRHGYITPPFVDATIKISIDDIYVSSVLVTQPKKKDDEPGMFQRSDFLSNLYRAVLLGNPGGGKSTFTSKLCYDISTKYQQRLVAGRLVTPILIILRDYGTQKKENHCSILEFIERTANSHYQIRPPKGAFEYLLLNGRAFLIFDGLDELLDTSYRQEISNDVETFCARYPSVPVLVTSREVGYEQAPLDSKKFEIFRLAPFDNDQVREYVTKWFAIESDLTQEQQKQQTRSFLRESQNVHDLRSNPLMLALMCNIYRGENYIPKNRPEIYQRCATMLFERWDKSRNIHVELPFEEHIKPAMAYLAHWIYSEEALQAGVTERKLIQKTADYLIIRRFEDRAEAESAASDFIGFCRGRAWVFTDTGTTADGERLYQFTHQTFLEYFTADYLVRTRPTSEDLVEALMPKIARREWDIVAQLTFQMHNRRLEGAGDELLLALVNNLEHLDSEEQWNVLSFAVRCLEFIVPSPKVTRTVTVEALDLCLNLGDSLRHSRSRRGRDFRYEIGVAEIIGYLLHATNENRAPIADSLEKLLIERIHSDANVAVLAVEVGLNLASFLHFVVAAQRHTDRNMRPDLRPELLDFWNEVSERIYISSRKKMLELASDHFNICIELLEKGDVTLNQFVGWYGTEGIFREVHFRLLPSTRFSKADRFILSFRRYSIALDTRLDITTVHEGLRELGRILIASPSPWVQQSEQINSFRFPWYFLEEERNPKSSKLVLPELDSDALFGLFCIVATTIEGGIVTEEPRQRTLFDEHFFEKLEQAKIVDHPLTSLRNILSSRFQIIEPESIEAELRQGGFSVHQSDFIWKWVRQDIHFVQTAKTGKKPKRKRS